MFRASFALLIRLRCKPHDVVTSLQPINRLLRLWLTMGQILAPKAVFRGGRSYVGCSYTRYRSVVWSRHETGFLYRMKMLWLLFCC